MISLSSTARRSTDFFPERAGLSPPGFSQKPFTFFYTLSVFPRIRNRRRRTHTPRFLQTKHQFSRPFNGTASPRPFFHHTPGAAPHRIFPAAEDFLCDPVPRARSRLPPLLYTTALLLSAALWPRAFSNIDSTHEVFPLTKHDFFGLLAGDAPFFAFLPQAE